MTKDNDTKPITQTRFMNELYRYKKGSVSRRHFLGVTGLGTAMAALAGSVPGMFSQPAFAGADLGNRLNFATWPNYLEEQNLVDFTELTGVNVNVSVFGSNEEMLAKLQAGGTGWDVFVPTNYTISTYGDLGLIQEIDLSKVPNYSPATNQAKFTEQGVYKGKTYALPKDWGTTGYVVNTANARAGMTSWKEFWDGAMNEYSDRVIVHDYQLTAIGNALKYFGYSFNSVDPAELAEAEKLMIEVKPHLFAVTSDYQPGMRSGDAWISMAWTGDAVQLKRDIPTMAYVLGKEGGEIWSDFYAIPTGAPHLAAAYAFLNFMQDPSVNAKESLAHGYPLIDSRAIALLPEELTNSPILYPAAELMSPLEFGAATTLTNPDRAELMARFKAA
jgi:spermidine/putrescine transport system substrate-binding protein